MVLRLERLLKLIRHWSDVACTRCRVPTCGSSAVRSEHRAQCHEEEAAAAWQANVRGQRLTDERKHRGVNRGTHSNKHVAAGIAGTALLRSMQCIHRSTPGRASKSMYSSRLLQVTTTLALSLSLSAAAAVKRRAGDGCMHP